MQPSLDGLGNVKTLIASGDRINVRSQPSTSSPVLKAINKGQVVGTIADSFEGGDGYVWYELNEGGFVREDVVSASTTTQSQSSKSKFNFVNPWVIGLGVLVIAGIGYAISSRNGQEEAPASKPSAPGPQLSGRSKKKKNRILKPQRLADAEN